MAKQDEIDRFFKDVVLDYNGGDIKKLIKAKDIGAGPLLTSTVNGIDILGGMIDGFSARDIDRMKKVMMPPHMNLTDEQATLIYQLVRNGMVHEGVTKHNVIFGIPQDRDTKRTEIFYKGEYEGKDVIGIDVLALANKFNEVVKEFIGIKHILLKDVPDYNNNKCKDAFGNCFTTLVGVPDISVLIKSTEKTDEKGNVVANDSSSAMTITGVSGSAACPPGVSGFQGMPSDKKP